MLYWLTVVINKPFQYSSVTKENNKSSVKTGYGSKFYQIYG